MRKIFGTLCLSVATTMSITGCANSFWSSKSPDRSASSIPLANVPEPSSADKPSFWSKTWDAIKPKHQPVDDEQGKIKATPFEADFAIGRLAERKGDFAMAEKAYRGMLKKYGERPEVLHRLGVLAAERNRLDDSERFLAAAYQGAPENVDIVNDLAYNLFLQNRFTESEQLFRKALDIDPHNDRATNNLALAVGFQGRTDESLSLFRTANSEGEAMANIAYIYSQNNELDRAESAYHQALAQDNSLRRAAEGLVQVDRAQKMIRLAELQRQQQSPEGQQEASEIKASLVNSSPRKLRARTVAPRTAQESASVQAVASNQPAPGAVQQASSEMPVSQPQNVATNAANQAPAAKPELVNPTQSSVPKTGNKHFNPKILSSDRFKNTPAAAKDPVAELTNQAVNWKPAVNNVVPQQSIPQRQVTQQLPATLRVPTTAAPASFAAPTSPTYSLPSPSMSGVKTKTSSSGTRVSFSGK